MLNLGTEGLMSIGAVAGFAAAHHSASAAVGALAGCAAGAALALVFAFVAITLVANQVASGLALSILGVGLSAFIGKPYESLTLPPVAAVPIPILSDIPVLGAALFDQQALVYASWLLCGAVAWFLYRSRAGLALRAIGEAPAAAFAVGLPVVRVDQPQTR